MARGGRGGGSRTPPAVPGLLGRAIDRLPAPKARIRFDAGRRGAWDPRVNPRRGTTLRPDTEYVEKSTGYRYRTDSRGRVTHFSGNLQAGPGVRNQRAQSGAGGTSRRRSDVGGHMIARMFLGPGDRINLTPLDSQVNGSARWGRMEAAWERALSGTPPSSVQVDGHILYPDEDTLRPDRLEITSQIDNHDPQVWTYQNRRR